MSNDLEARRLAIAHALREAMTEPETQPVDPTEPLDEADAETSAPAIPPLEPIGEMSPAAARALFGHH